MSKVKIEFIKCNGSHGKLFQYDISREGRERVAREHPLVKQKNDVLINVGLYYRVLIEFTGKGAEPAHQQVIWWMVGLCLVLVLIVTCFQGA